MSKSRLNKQLTVSVVLVVMLSLCLCITTYALVTVSDTVFNNTFKTGYINIEINEGKVLFPEASFRFEPGMTLEKDVPLVNNSTDDAYYRVYFSQIQGDLADILIITIKDGDQLLYTGTARRLTAENVQIGTISAGATRTLSVSFHYPEAEGNNGQGKQLSFDLCAEAVQSKNNPDKTFQ